MFELFTIATLSFFLITCYMTLIWFIYLYHKNSSLIDFGWTSSFVVISIVCIFQGGGDFSKKALLASLICLWSFRLSFHLLKRVFSNKDDPRYVEIKSKWTQKHVDLKFLLLFWFQGLLVILLSLPLICVSINANSTWSVFEGLAVILWLIGLTGESIADRQLLLFKLNPANKGKVCEMGLWYYSRHPNYFFEFIIHLSFFVFALGSSFSIFTILSPLLMLYLLTKVSGIPPAEAQSIKSKGSKYIDYQKTTSAFVPWFKKS